MRNDRKNDAKFFGGHGCLRRLHKIKQSYFNFDTLWLFRSSTTPQNFDFRRVPSVKSSSK